MKRLIALCAMAGFALAPTQEAQAQYGIGCYQGGFNNGFASNQFIGGIGYNLYRPNNYFRPVTFPNNRFNLPVRTSRNLGHFHHVPGVGTVPHRHRVWDPIRRRRGW